MKKQFLILGISLLASKTFASPVTGSMVINEKRNSAVVSFKNTSDKEVYCEQFRFSFKAVGDEFGESIGGFSEIVKSVYLQPKQEVAMDNLARDLAKMSTPNRVAILSDAEADFSACREVNFNDYCNFAPKDKNETYTLQRISEAAKTERCEDIEKNLQGKLKLKEAGIYSVKPISYLGSLVELNLSKNNIASVSELSSLNQLKMLNLGYNPIVEIDNLVNLPNITSIDASHTNLAFKAWKKVSSKLKVRVYGTPFEEEVKQRKLN